jgi:carbamoyltransferase
MGHVVLGLNIPETRQGKKLKDGGAALIYDGRLLGALAEERISRVKYEGGSTKSALALLSDWDLSPSDVNLIVLSTCCEPERVLDLYAVFPNAYVRSCNHHLSHAFSAYCPSSFDEALVIVLDGGGNVLVDAESANWWEYR